MPISSLKRRLVRPIRTGLFRALGFDREELLHKLRERSAPIPSLEEWFLGWIIRQNTYAQMFSPKNVYFEFGVADGNSLATFINAAKRFCARYHRPLTDFTIYAFDSFSGLPEKEAQEAHLDWTKGQFSVPRHIAESKVKEAGFPFSNIHFIEGFYTETLTTELLNDIRANNAIPSIITIDCDYYSSTKQAIDWLFPVLQSGCVFYFDDIWSFHGHPKMGELGYINEFNDDGRGHLAPCHIFGLEHHSFIYSRREWEWR